MNRFFSFPYLIHAHMEEALFRFWKGSLSLEQGHFLLKGIGGNGPRFFVEIDQSFNAGG